MMLLDNAVVSLPVKTEWLGETRLFQVYAGAGDLVGTAISVAISALVTAPMAPVHLLARRTAGGDIELLWTRAGALPPEHLPERYAVGIVDGVTIRRSFESAIGSAVYPLDQQIADFGGPASNFTFTVTQISTVLGAGQVAEGAFYG